MLDVRNLKLAGLSFLVGAVVVPIGDWVHVITGTTGYPPEVYRWYLGGVPFWVPLLFGSASLTMTLGLAVVEKLFPIQASSSKLAGQGKLQSAIVAALLFQGIYLLSGVLTRVNPQGNLGINDFLLAALAIFSWWRFDRTAVGVVLGVLNAIVGVAFEANLVRLGIFWYMPNADHLFGVGSWLPWIYFAAGPALRGLRASIFLNIA